jgi:SAM-dependent methyltransferase
MNDIVDLIGTSGGGEDFFDPGEFSLRATLEDEHYWHLHRRAVLCDLLSATMPDRTLPIIELGCGVGTVATFLNAHGFRVDYADVHAEALRLARSRAGVAGRDRRFIRVDVTRGLPPGDYRGVLLLDVLEHLPDDRGVMRAAHASLAGRPDAFVLFTVPAFRQLWSPWDDLEKHKRRYTLAEARALANETGFAVAQASYFFFPLFFAAAAVKGLRVARGAIAGPPPPPRFDQLTESRNSKALNRAMLRLLASERRWLSRRPLPLGTSIFVLAQPR